MHIPKKERWTREEIIEYMKTCAKQYVPEWRYDTKNPDAGTALASLFADMMCDTVKRFNLTVAGDMLSFFDELHAKMLPARPAEGFVSFALPQGYEGEEEVLPGTKLLSQGQGEMVVFETQEETFVRQMELERIFLSRPQEDGIYQIYQKEQEEPMSFLLFQGKGPNLQQHKIVFCFEKGLEIMSKAQAVFSFQLESATGGGTDWQQAVEQGKICFSYGTKEGFRPIHGKGEDDAVFFELAGGEEGIAVKEEYESMYVIQADISDPDLFSQIYFSAPALSIKSQGIKPDFIYGNGMDQEMEDFFVFGRTPSVYDECYIASEEVLGKAGAVIQIEFDLDFVKLPLEAEQEEMIRWKTVMKKRDFIPEKEYDITIQEVLWEYFNGYGWTRLPEGSAYGKLFTPKEDVRGARMRMEFVCPLDIQRALVGSAETYAIRDRALRVGNAYKTRGAYIAPLAGRVLLSYDYGRKPLAPRTIIKWNHLQREEISEKEMAGEGCSVSFCQRNPDKKAACYLGFLQPPMGAPLKFLFVMEDSMRQDMPMVKWEYLGEGGWKEMHPMDGTKRFHHTGMISWSGNYDMRRENLFGQELYWVRILDQEDGYQQNNRVEWCPRVEKICPNCARILGVETLEEEYRIPLYGQEKTIQLPYGDIAEIAIWVFKKWDYRQGMLGTAWEQWKEAESLDSQSGERKEFSIHRQTGLITFPKYMDQACFDETEDIRVRVRCQHCQGEKGNLKEGDINRLEQTVGFINSSYNPVASGGGVPRETVLEAVDRNAQILRHGYRCVSARDYEDMAREAARNLCKVKCFPGHDQSGRKQPGSVTLVILPDEYKENPYSFEKARMQIFEFISTRMDGNILDTGRFSIVRPDMLRLDVKVTVALTDEKEAISVRKRAAKELERFLHPLEGNFYGEGWEIGTVPGKNQVMHALKRVEGVRHIRQLSLRKFLKGRIDPVEAGEEELPRYLLPESGNHEIQIEAPEIGNGQKGSRGLNFSI